MSEQEMKKNTTITLFDIWKHIKQYKKIIIVTIIVFFIVGSVFLYILPKKGYSAWRIDKSYKITALLFISKIPVNVDLDIPKATMNLLRDVTVVKSAYSRAIDKIDERKNIPENQVKKFIKSNDLKIEYKHGWNAVRVILTHKDKNFAKTMVTFLEQEVRDILHNEIKHQLQGRKVELNEVKEEIISDLSSNIKNNKQLSNSISKSDFRDLLFEVFSKSPELLSKYKEKIETNIKINKTIKRDDIPWPEEIKMNVGEVEPFVFAKKPFIGLIVFAFAGLVIGLLLTALLNYLSYYKKE